MDSATLLGVASGLLDVLMDDPRDRMATLRALREATRRPRSSVPTLRLVFALTQIENMLSYVHGIVDLDRAALALALEQAIRADERFAEFARAPWRIELADARHSAQVN